MLEGQRLSYRTLDVEQLGSVYESLMGYHVLRVTSPAVRVGKYRVWVEASEVAAKSPSERKTFWKEACGLNPGPAASIEAALKDAGRDLEAVAVGLLQHSAGGKAERDRQRAEVGSLVLQPGEERRRTGTHYTPRSLTERVVKKTLEPLFACLGRHRTAEQILHRIRWCVCAWHGVHAYARGARRAGRKGCTQRRADVPVFGRRRSQQQSNTCFRTVRDRLWRVALSQGRELA